jgi:NAD(P)-dependent dehydrogenase (short-subunit alcohol dehydrogenase family)
VLVNNAGAVFARRELTAEGIEKTFAVNHLAPFLLTNLLLDRVRAAPAGRIVMVTSGTYSSALDFDNLQSEKGHQFLGAYFRSKLENILFTFELSRRLAGTPVTANCLFPGPTRTRFGNNLDGLAALFGLFMQNFPFLASPEKGARTAIYLASSPEVAGVTGRFYVRCREVRTKPVTHDVGIARRLWSVSEALSQPSETEAGSGRMVGQRGTAAVH